MSVRIVRLGTPRVAGEGLRIGTVRRPPRGVPAARFASEDWYDVWYPILSPSVGTMKLGRALLASRGARIAATSSCWAPRVAQRRSPPASSVRIGRAWRSQRQSLRSLSAMFHQWRRRWLRR